MRFDHEKVVRILCLNCHRQVDGLMSVEGVTKIKCPYCGAVTVSKVMGRRHVQQDTYAPKGPMLIL